MRFWSLAFYLALILGLIIFPFQVQAQSRRGAFKAPIATPSPSPTPGPVDSYDLFWPISAGKVMGDPLYFLKSLKESLSELLVFGDYKKAEHNISLSEKRIVEAEYLFMVKKDFRNARESAKEAKSKMEKAIESVKKAEKSP